MVHRRYYFASSSRSFHCPPRTNSCSSCPFLDQYSFLEPFSPLMEVPGMDEVKKDENHIAFIDEGIQDELDDACSICLESFSHTDPSTVTNCRHEFHLQCILEWCERSSNCPMCWQAISLKDSASQQLLAEAEQERLYRSSGSRNLAIHHPPALSETQHSSEEANDLGFADRIIEQVIVAASTWRSHDIARADSGASSSPSGGQTEIHPSPSLLASDNRSYSSESPSPSTEQSFSDTWRSQLNSISFQYTESISRNTRGWTDKLFSRSSSSMADIVSEVSSGIARMMESLETERPSNGSNTASSAS